MIILPINNLKESNFKGYAADTGEDIAVPKGTVVVACADGKIIYSERGHTPWSPENHPECPNDTPNSILLEFREPQKINGVTYYYAWYTHLSKLYYNVSDGSSGLWVKAGEKIGETGIGNNDAHLHFGLIINRIQNDGDYMPQPELKKYLIGILRNTIKPSKDKDLVKGFFHDGKFALIVNCKTIYLDSFEFTGVIKNA